MPMLPLKAALRSLRFRKRFTLLNVGGLALAFAAALVMALILSHELGHDRYHANGERIYRVVHDETTSGPQGRLLATTSPPAAPALRRTFPEVEAAVRIRFTDEQIVASGNRVFYEANLVYADSSLLSVFTFPLRKGDAATALAGPNRVVITPEVADRYFGDTDPIGQTLRINDALDVTVTGVLEPLPSNGHLSFELAVSFETFRVPTGYPVTLDDWRWISFHTYLLLREGADPAALEARLPAFVESHWPPARTRPFHWRLQPLHDIYLGPVHNPDIASGSLAYLAGLGAATILILVMAGFNFTNLSIALAVTRIRQGAVRKVLGASSVSLARQFLAESLLLAVTGLLLGIAMIDLLAAPLGNWLDLPFAITPLRAVLPVAGMAAVALVIGTIAGAYPAWLVARPPTIGALKGELHAGKSGVRVRKVLVTLQFTITIALLLAGLVIVSQLRYIGEKDLGFTREAVLMVPIPRDRSDLGLERLRHAVADHPGIVKITAGHSALDGDQGSVGMYPEGGTEENGIPVNIYGVQFEYFETLGIDIVNGRAFSRDIATDTSAAIILNRAAVAALPWSDPVGRSLRISDLVDGTVVGVVEDFHFAPLHQPVGPLAMFITPLVRTVFLRLDPADVATTVSDLDRIWTDVFPGLPFAYRFLDDNLDRMYRTERRFARIIGAFAILTALIAVLGLYGLTAFVVERRTREIGIRRVLGATPEGLILLLSRDFLLLVVLANLLAWPAAGFAMRHWLEAFAYRIDLQWWMFGLAGGGALLLAMLTVGWRASLTALRNPVHALRQE